MENKEPPGKLYLTAMYLIGGHAANGSFLRYPHPINMQIGVH